MKTSLAILFLLLAAVGAREPFACDPSDAATKTLPFCRADLRTEERIRDLIGRLTLQEKVKLLGNNAAAVPRLVIKGYEWWSEACPTSVRGRDSAATSPAPPVSRRSSTPPPLSMEEIGKVVSDEARAMYNGGAAGLTYWSPNVNILRDPRWGRGQETPDEYPLVAGEYAARYVRGLQGTEGGDRLKVAACCKHYTAYDLDNWSGVDRFHFNAKFVSLFQEIMIQKSNAVPKSEKLFRDSRMSSWMRIPFSLLGQVMNDVIGLVLCVATPLGSLGI